MIRKLYDNNVLKIRTIWHFINAKLLSYSTKRQLIRKWDEIVWHWHKKRNQDFFIKRTTKLNYLLDINNLIDLRFASRGSYEKQQQDHFVSLIDQYECTIFCDIGANWGMYSLLASTTSSITEIHAFEPDKKNQSQLFANIFLNQIHDKISVHSTALSSFDGEAKFASTDSHANKTSEIENRGTSKLDETGDKTVIVSQLDTLLHYSGKNIILKIDIEGNELDAIRGMKKLLENNRCVLQIETFSDKSAALISEMQSLSYQCTHRIENDHYFEPA